jgi:hypothetical protein
MQSISTCESDVVGMFSPLIRRLNNVCTVIHGWEFGLLLW